MLKYFSMSAPEFDSWPRRFQEKVFLDVAVTYFNGAAKIVDSGLKMLIEHNQNYLSGSAKF